MSMLTIAAMSAAFAIQPTHTASCHLSGKTVLVELDVREPRMRITDYAGPVEGAAQYIRDDLAGETLYSLPDIGYVVFDEGQSRILTFNYCQPCLSFVCSRVPVPVDQVTGASR